LEELEQETLNERLAEADHVPIHVPSGAQKTTVGTCCDYRTGAQLMCCNIAPKAVVEDDEEAQLRELQASLAMV